MNSPEYSPNPGDASSVDVTNCDREPIHIPGAVQPFAALIAVSSDWIITHLSQNASEILGIDGLEIGRVLSEELPSETIHELRTRLQIGGDAQTLVRIFEQPIVEGGKLFDISLHRSDETLIFEFEPTMEDAARADVVDVQNIMARIAHEPDNNVIYRRAVQGLRAITGFDRVMLYKFQEDASGTVVAEAADPTVTSYKGLRFPASDIPKQARALYKRSVLRIISDVDSQRVAVEPQLDPYGNPLDLSLSVSRAVSPIHLEYLRNMGVQASMSVSIIVKGELWGLFACHNETPHHLCFRMRTLCELYAQLFSYDIARREAERDSVLERDAHKLHQTLIARAARGTLLTNFETLSEEIANVIAFDGIAIYEAGRYQSSGAAPTEAEFIKLSRHLNTTMSGQVFATNNVTGSFPAAKEFDGSFAGILALPISRKPRDYVVLFRREIVKQVHWAGNPNKPVIATKNGAYLTPRASFDRWQEVVKGHSAPWTEPELRAANSIRVTLLEVILKMSDAAATERARANEHQELLIAELNHRVRNILNLVRGLVTHGASGQESVAAVTETLGSRISALARAHDQLTDTAWGVSSLRDMIMIEAGAFVDDTSQRVRFTGDDHGLTAEAFSSLALVIHELVTNSVKYGALKSESGHIDVTLDKRPDGSLKIDWSEHGGHEVKPPSRRGFGTAIIEKSVPHELGGTSELRFEPDGLKVEIVIPASNIKPPPEKDGAETERDWQDMVDESVALPSNVLLLEDNVVIAMDVAGHLEDHGVVEVFTTSRVSEALAVIQDHEIQAAVLDVNLGGETSEPVARALARANIPFALVTGYAGEQSVLKAFPRAPVLRKPFRPEELISVLRSSLRR